MESFQNPCPTKKQAKRVVQNVTRGSNHLIVRNPKVIQRNEFRERQDRMRMKLARRLAKQIEEEEKVEEYPLEDPDLIKRALFN
jgi:hypothetical protein